MTPVMYVDPSGNIAFFIVAGIVFAIIGGGVGAYYGLSQGHTDMDLVKDIAIGATIGFVAGAIAGAAYSSFVTASAFTSFEFVVYGTKTMYVGLKTVGVTTTMINGLSNVDRAMNDALGGVFNPMTNFSTGRTQPNSLAEQMHMSSLLEDSINRATFTTKCTRIPYPGTWNKYQSVLKNSVGDVISVIHFTHNAINNIIIDFKFMG